MITETWGGGQTRWRRVGGGAEEQEEEEKGDQDGKETV